MTNEEFLSKMDWERHAIRLGVPCGNVVSAVLKRRECRPKVKTATAFVKTKAAFTKTKALFL